MLKEIAKRGLVIALTETSRFYTGLQERLRLRLKAWLVKE
jgi:hypothetical protein